MSYYKDENDNIVDWSEDMKKDPTIPETRPIQELPQSLQDVYAELVDAYFPKGKTKMRGEAMTMMVSFMIEVRKELATQAQLHDQEMRDMEEKCDVRVGKAIRNEFEAANDDFEELLIVHKASTELKQAFAKRKNIFTTNSGEKKS